LRYVPKSQRKEGNSPFIGVANEGAEDKIIKKANEVSMTALKGSTTVPTLKAWQTKVVGLLFLGLLFPLQEPITCRMHGLKRDLI